MIHETRHDIANRPNDDDGWILWTIAMACNALAIGLCIYAVNM